MKAIRCGMCEVELPEAEAIDGCHSEQSACIDALIAARHVYRRASAARIAELGWTKAEEADMRKHNIDPATVRASLSAFDMGDTITLEPFLDALDGKDPGPTERERLHLKLARFENAAREMVEHMCSGGCEAVCYAIEGLRELIDDAPPRQTTGPK